MVATIAGLSGGSLPQIVSGASPYSSPTTKMSNLFQTIDTGKTGSISQQQFNQAFSTLNPPGRFQTLGASAIFSQLDPHGTGTVSQSAFVSGMLGVISSFSSSTSSSGATSLPASTPAQSLGQSQQSLEDLLSSTPLNSPPGSIVNKQV